MMMRKIGVAAITALFVCLICSSFTQGANSPYTVYGRIYINGTPINDIQVSIYDSSTGGTISYTEYSSLITWTGINGAGYYSGNIGNMPSWNRGDLVYVRVTYGGQMMSSNFTIPTSGYIYNCDVHITTSAGSGGSPSEGVNQWHGVPTLEEILAWIRGINLIDLAIALLIALFIVFLIILIAKRRRR